MLAVNFYEFPAFLVRTQLDWVDCNFGSLLTWTWVVQLLNCHMYHNLGNKTKEMYKNNLSRTTFKNNVPSLPLGQIFGDINTYKI